MENFMNKGYAIARREETDMLTRRYSFAAAKRDAIFAALKSGWRGQCLDRLTR